MYELLRFPKNVAKTRQQLNFEVHALGTPWQI